MYVSLSPDPLRIGSPVPPSNPTIAESSGVCQSPASKKKSLSQVNIIHVQECKQKLLL